MSHSAESVPLRLAILTVSDTRTAANDTSGDLLVERAETFGHEVADRRLVKDDPEAIMAIVDAWIAREDVDAILSTGGTGVTGRDVTADVFQAMYDKPIPGFGELFRMLSYEEIGTATINSRANAGVVRGTLVFALPGSTGACRTAWDRILVEQLDTTHKPCNLAALIPRLRE